MCCTDINREPIVTYEVKIPNTDPAVSLPDLKSACLVDFPDDDALIADLGRYAEEFVEANTGFGIGEKTITVYSNADGIGWLPLVPVVGIEKVDANRFNTVKGSIDMQVGYNSANLPFSLKQAIRKIVAQAYWKREDQSIENLYEVIGSSHEIIKSLRRRTAI